MQDNRSEGKKFTLLIVDDTPENIAIMSELLGPRYHLRIANNGARALALTRGGNVPDLILLDIMMPGLSGYDVCAALKADVATRDIPVIFLSAKSDFEDEQKGLQVGAVDFITKPINPALLFARIEAHLPPERPGVAP